MVSRDSSMASGMNITRQCTVSGVNTDVVPSDDLGSYLGWKANQNTFVSADSLPQNFQLLSDTICRPEDLSGRRVFEETKNSRGSSMNLEGNNECCHRGFTSGQGQRLALSLNSHFPADSLINPSQLGQNDQWVEAERSQNGRMVQITTDRCMSSQNGLSMASFAGHHLRNSRYLKAAQQLLDEIVCVSNAGDNEMDDPLNNGSKMQNTARALQPDRFLNFQDIQALKVKGLPMKESNDHNGRTCKLLALMRELEHQYDKYFHQMDEIVSKFELVGGTGSSKSYVALTIKAMSLHFSNLREAIFAHLNTSTSPSPEVNIYSGNNSKLNFSVQKHFSQIRGTQNLGMIPSRQIWRPLRGLPENSVAILRTWLFEHFLHPYPNDNEKFMLSSQTGLTRNQISNWFINARVRLWKPMIEDMYREEFAEDTNDLKT